MRQGRNLIAGFGNSLWSAIVGLVAVPFYLKYLGVEAYGLIGFFVTVQTLLTLLDMGMAPTVTREVARQSATQDLADAGKLIHTLAVVYWCMAALIFVGFLVVSPWIAGDWLKSETLSPGTTQRAAMCIGLVIACRWPIGLYQAALLGAHRVALFSAINVVMMTFSTVGAVAVLAFVSNTIEAFFLWQAGVGLLYALVIRSAAWRVIGSASKRFDLQQLRAVWRFTLGMSAITVFGLVFSQMDKVLLSKLLSLQDYAYYMLATALTGALYLLVAPIYNIVGPRFSALIASAEMGPLADQYQFYTRLLAFTLFPACMVIVVASRELVFAWTGNSALATAVAPLASLMAVGTAFNGIMYVPHALQLAYGCTRLPLLINGILMVLVFPVTIYLALEFGALGGALAWLLLHSLYVLLGTWLTHRRFLVGYGAKWLFSDVGVPLALSVAMGLLLMFTFQQHSAGLGERLALSVAAGLLVAGAFVLTTPRLMLMLRQPNHE